MTDTTPVEEPSPAVRVPGDDGNPAPPETPPEVEPTEPEPTEEDV